MRQTYEAQFAAAAAYRSQHHAGHLGRYGSSIRVRWCKRYKKHSCGGEGREEEDSNRVGYCVNEVRRAQLHEEGGYDIAEQNDPFRYRWTDEIEGSGEDNDI